MFFLGVEWIFDKANLSVEEMGILIQDYGETKASIIDGGGQALLIHPDLLIQAQQIFEQLEEMETSMEELEVTLDTNLVNVPQIDCLFIDYLEHIGVEEGTHWIQGLVTRGEKIDGFTSTGSADRLILREGENENDAIRRFLAERDHLNEQTKPHEINAKYWVNEYFKEKYGDSPFQALYDALKKIADGKENKKQRPKFLKSFLGRNK